MPTSNISIRTSITSSRFTSSQIEKEISFLQSYSAGFKSVLSDLSPNLRGKSIDNIVVTDDVNVFPSKRWGSFEQTFFNRENNTLYVGLNPDATGLNQADNRPFTIGELITHGLAHFTVDAQANYRGDFIEYDQELVATRYTNMVADDFGLSRSTAFKIGASNYGPLFCTKENIHGGEGLPTYIQRCFIAGTKVLMGDGSEKTIENIKLGDMVASFSATESNGRDSLESRKVTRLFRNTTQMLIDLRGVKCTPGHAFLSTDLDDQAGGMFIEISRVLQMDGIIVASDGNLIRARTGANIGSSEDVVISVIYFDALSGESRTVRVRSGMPVPIEFPASGNSNNEAKCYSLNQFLAEHGNTIDKTGIISNEEYEVFRFIDWPLGSTPFDTIEMQNWVVTGPDGQPYTPPWIADLPEEDERANLRVVGEMPGVSLSAL